MIDLRLDEELAVITLRRPERRNALTPEMLGALASAVREAEDSGAIVLLGEGPAFCAGFDLHLCRDAPDGSVLRELLAGLAGAIAALRTAGPPVVMGAHSAAIAGGCALLGGADFVFTDDGATLGYPVVTLGISPAVSAPFLRLAVGDGTARARLLEPSLFDGREAVRIGLAHESLAAPAIVGPRALECARELARKPRRAMRATKRWLAEVTPADGTAALEASLSLTGGDEERRLLPRAWSRPAR